MRYASFEGKCRACKRRILPGDEIVYTRERGTRHVGCRDRQITKRQNPRRESTWGKTKELYGAVKRSIRIF